ncbi:MAG TPA: hypothetical protein VM198_00235 [Longimicrobiales bacterium]|nr:hypothetical protein [Longimicrobiales bacterium]
MPRVVPAILPRFYRHMQELEDARKLGRILEETGELPEGAQVAAGATAAGDPRRLRGVPAIRRGVSGAIPGTSPHEAVLRRENGRRR